jgi:hypothetical protein
LKMIVTPSKIFATPVKMLWKLISLGENALENICYSSENALKIDFIWWKCFENWFNSVKMLWKMFATPMKMLWKLISFGENALEDVCTPVKMLWKLISFGENALENVCYSSENALKIEESQIETYTWY